MVSENLAKRHIGKIFLTFQDWLAITPLKSSTRRVYVSRLKQIVIFTELNERLLADDDGDFARLTNAYISFARAENLITSHSVNNFITMFRLMAKVTGITNFSFQRHVSENAERAVLNESEQERYIDAAKAGNSCRDLVLALVFLKTNIRLGEAIDIRVSDLIWEASEAKISIRGRTGQRMEVLDKTVRQAIQSWLIERSRSDIGTNSPYLFFGAAGGKITSSSLDTALRKIGWRARLNVSARVLRNTYMSDSLQTEKQNAVNILDIAAGC